MTGYREGEYLHNMWQGRRGEKKYRERHREFSTQGTENNGNEEATETQKGKMEEWNSLDARPKDSPDTVGGWLSEERRTGAEKGTGRNM